LKLSVTRLQEKNAGLLQSNTLVKNLKRNLEDEVEFTRKNIASLQEDLGDFLTRQLTILRLQELFDEDVIRREEARIDLEQNKIG